MTTKPELNLGRHLLPGIVALGLFALMAAIISTASFGDPAGFEGIDSVTGAIGFSLINIDVATVSTETEGFLAQFEMIAFVLVAALVGGVTLARREVDGEVVTALRSEVDHRWGSEETDAGRPADEEEDNR
ncbi:MAG: NADH-quinone oxidoreductase subunit J [Halobacteriales archaeon]